MAGFSALLSHRKLRLIRKGMEKSLNFIAPSYCVSPGEAHLFSLEEGAQYAKFPKSSFSGQHCLFKWML